MSAEEENVNLAAKLRAVELPAANVNRDRLMYESGAAAERALSASRQRGWRLAAVACGATAAALALLVGLRPAKERIVYVERSMKPAETFVVAPLTDPQLPVERGAARMFQLRELALKDEWRDPPAENTPRSPVVTPASLPRFDLNKAAGEAFPLDGRM